MSATAENVRQFTVGYDDDGIRLDRWFKRHLPETSFNLVSRWARTGQLRIDGKRATPGDRIEAGQIIRVPPADPLAEPAVKSAPPKRAKERVELPEDETVFAESLVIHKDKDALVLNKPPGLATQGGTGTTEHVDRLLDALWFEAEGRPKLVHRLDKDTSGALLVARNSRAAAHFAKAFSSRTARKVYWALVMGVPAIEDGMIELPIAKQPGTGGEKMYVDEKEGSPARTRYRVVEAAGSTCAWLELQPFTGRTHQLRVHLSAIGHPIVGDGKYGGRDAFLTGTISRKMHLHARRIRVDALEGPQIDVTADLPEHIAESFDNLGFDLSNGNLPIDDLKFKETPEYKARLAANIAKAARKERKGERRGRGRVEESKPKGKPARGRRPAST